MNNHYNPNLKKYANDLRNESVSRAEKYLWKAGLRAKKVGVAFKRQRPIDRFIVDFFSAEINWLIEVDGSSHDTKGRYDSYRQDRLEAFGYTVIRFHEGAVIHRYAEFEKNILMVIALLKRSME